MSGDFMSQSIKRIIYIGLFGIVLIGGLLFFVKNNQLQEFNYIIGSVELPLSILLLTSLAIGAILGIAATIPLILRLNHQKSRLEKQVKLSEKEINNLRTLPAKQSH
jgi:lipopolysaccharide assembly protein A